MHETGVITGPRFQDEVLRIAGAIESSLSGKYASSSSLPTTSLCDDEVRSRTLPMSLLAIAAQPFS